MPYTPKKTVEAIVGSGNDYCIGLKKNQPKLLHQARQCTQTQAALSDYHSCDRSHGRIVKRRVRVFASPPALSGDWAGLAAFVLVERSGIRSGKAFERQAWFIISRVIEAERLAGMIQAHRGTTENKLHWVKDVVQGEDASLIQAAKPATLMGLLRSWAISAFRGAGHSLITKAMRRFKHDLPTLISFL